MAIFTSMDEMLHLCIGSDKILVAKAVQSAVQKVGSSAKLASSCKVSPSTILRLQKGKCRPSKRTFHQLYKYIAPFLPQDVWIGLSDSKRSRIIIRRKTKIIREIK